MAIRQRLKNTLGTILGYSKSPTTGKTFWREIDYSKDVFFFEEIRNNVETDESSSKQLYLQVKMTGLSKSDISGLLSATLKGAKGLKASKTVEVKAFYNRKEIYLHVSGESNKECHRCARDELLEKLKPKYSKYFRFRDLTRKEKAKKVLKKAAHFALLLQLCLPATGLLLNVVGKDNISIKKAKEEFKLEDYPITPFTTQEEFLCIANYTVHKAVDEQRADMWRNPVCEDYARATKKMYNHIMEEAGLEEFKEDVTLRFGEVKARDSLWFHAWLDIRNSNRSRSYFESTRYVPPIKDKELAIDYCLNNNFDIVDWEENYTFVKSTANGIFYPTAEGFFVPGGAGRAIYSTFTNYDEMLHMFGIRWDNIGEWMHDYTNFLNSGKPMP
ncbi:MAG: hypothetical protein ABIB71_00225 [Candidatus Woesearchaeota archaeon]